MPFQNSTRPTISTATELTFSRSQRARLRCQLAKQLERAGEYETACEALVEFWPERGESLSLDGLDFAAQAELLLRAGALIGWAGSSSQAGGAQESAKNLISRSIQIFEEVGEDARAAEARSDLALCYWREGAFDEARLILTDVVGRLSDNEEEARAVTLIRLAMVEKAAGRLSDSLRIHGDTAPLVERIENHAIKGTFHNQLGGLLACLGFAEESEHQIDRALVEYAAASFHFEQAGHLRFRASVENNLGYLLLRIRRFAEAHEHIDCALRICVELEDVRAAAQFEDTRAQAWLAEGRLFEAERFARKSVKTLESGGEQALLAESLNTLGVILARLGRHTQARVTLERAVEVARTSGDSEGAGKATLSILEELGRQIPPSELATIYQSAADLLERSQDPSTAKRLRLCARKVIKAFEASVVEGRPKEYNWDGFSLKREILNSEKMIIQRALIDSGGVVSRAARLLGFRHHQSLISLINSRHPDLLESRSKVRIRRRSIMRKA